MHMFICVYMYIYIYGRLSKLPVEILSWRGYASDPMRYDYCHGFRGTIFGAKGGMIAPPEKF